MALPRKKTGITRAIRGIEKGLVIKPREKYFFRLYVAGATVRSRQALQRVSQLCKAELKDNYEIEVIDVYQQPALARDNQIIATPTLVKELPPPVRRFIGNLSNLAGLFGEGDLTAAGKIAS